MSQAQMVEPALLTICKPIQAPLGPFDMPRLTDWHRLFTPMLGAGPALAESLQQSIPSARSRQFNLYGDRHPIAAVTCVFEPQKDWPKRLAIVTNPRAWQ